MYSITKNTEESSTFNPPNFKPALESFEQKISETIVNWFNDNNKTNKQESLVYNHLLNNPMVVGLSLQITNLETKLQEANKRIESLVNENNTLKLHLSSSDTKNVTLDITEITKNDDDNNDNPLTVITTDIQDENQLHLNQVVKKLESYACGYNIVSADNSDDEDEDDDGDEDEDNKIESSTTPYLMGALLVQNNINNIEPIKVVHALDDEKLITQDLTDNDIKSNEPIDDEIFESKVYDLVEDIEKSNTDTMDLIPTTEDIKSIDVDFDESFELIDSDDFIINEVNLSQDEINDQNIEEQTVLTFDLPISNSKDQRDETKDFEVFKLEDNINDIEVDDYIELVAVSESSPVGEETYTINDHIVIEQTDDKFEGQSKVEVVEPEIEVDKELILKKVTVKERQVSSEPSETVNPFDNPISKTLRDRADERRKKMKAFNYKFNTSKIDEYEKEPAYKRQGIELSNSNSKAENQVSRTSISYDENDDIQVRSNNSFLHDNVD